MNIRRKVREILDGLNNLFEWAPTIYNDRHFDYAFIYDILHKKLELQAKYIKDTGRHERNMIDYQKMMTCVRLIKIVRDENYIDEVVFIDIDDTKEFDKYLDRHKASVHKVLLDKKLQIFPCENSKNIAYNVAQYKHNRARIVLFNLISTHIHYWWD